MQYQVPVVRSSTTECHWKHCARY